MHWRRVHNFCGGRRLKSDPPPHRVVICPYKQLRYHSYQHTLDCTSDDSEVVWSNKGEFTVQSYKVESCV